MPAEGNTNYGENLMLFDQVFGTFFWPEGRRPPADIGIDGPMPKNFAGELAHGVRQAIAVCGAPEFAAGRAPALAGAANRTNAVAAVNDPGMAKPPSCCMLRGRRVRGQA